ncbi:quinone oxidoreductase family protein [Ensifer sp. 4252]|uniref:quinone oxidoreductase family protein n=1 Tax=Ensifer sp. 4252 TaxID=3373915 RepID=UPI003D1B248E
MHALVFDTFGEPEVLSYREVADPAVPSGHIQLATRAIGLNFADIYRRKGNYTLAGKAPHIAGYEGAGEVIAIGEGVEGVAIGDRIGFADVPFANATRVTVPLDRAIPLPDDIGFEAAAALLLQGLTAQYLVEDSYSVRAGETVLVQAAGGGVGQLLIRLAIARGASVIAMASTLEKQALAKAAGAAYALGYDEGWPDKVRALSNGGVDVAYDSVGITLLDSLSAVRSRGTLVTFGMAGGPAPLVDPRYLMEHSKTLVGGDLWDFLTDRQQRLSRAERLFQALRDGVIEPPRIETFALSDGAAAHARLEDRRFSGKIVLLPE